MITLELFFFLCVIFGVMLQLPIGPFYTFALNYLDWFRSVVGPIVAWLFPWLF